MHGKYCYKNTIIQNNPTSLAGRSEPAQRIGLIIGVMLPLFMEFEQFGMYFYA